MTYRYERKFLLNAQTAEILKRRAAAALRPDTHTNGRYWVHNLYFDDAYLGAYEDKIRGALSRSKFRVRFYNGDLSYIRLENKQKIGELTGKRSETVTERQYARLAAGDFHFALNLGGPVWDAFGQVYRTRGLRPAATFKYLREAYYHESSGARVTFDSRIAEEIPGLSGVMELKYTHYLPSFIAAMLEGLPVVQVETSKYGMVMERSGKTCTYAAAGYIIKHGAG